MYIIRKFNPNEWNLNFDCSPYTQYPKTCLTAQTWGSRNQTDLTMNLCYFNFDDSASRKANAVYRTLQYLRISKLGGDVAYGGTQEMITLPNGDKVAGFTLGIKDGKVYENNVSSKRTRNGFGITKDGVYFNVQTTSSVTIKSFCTTVNNQVKNVKLFLMMDGGGSTSCYARRSGIYFHPEGVRAIPSVLQATYKGQGVSRTLKQGMKGDDVMLLQMMLGNVECDGIFGLGTRNAVIQAQKFIFPKTKSEWDGIAGMKTLKGLGIWKG